MSGRWRAFCRGKGKQNRESLRLRPASLSKASIWRVTSMKYKVLFKEITRLTGKLRLTRLWLTSTRSLTVHHQRSRSRLILRPASNLKKWWMPWKTSRLSKFPKLLHCRVAKYQFTSINWWRSRIAWKPSSTSAYYSIEKTSLTMNVCWKKLKKKPGKWDLKTSKSPLCQSCRIVW